MTPIERAARAMYDTVQPDWDWDDPDAELLRRMYRENARAALFALRTPSKQQCVIGLEASTAHGGAALHDQGIEAIWTAMVDAALAEQA
ncbi:hypothetical protein PX699_10730 [Sphingobium sp. H39-3-25]|uniref:hypothetical protein n=1 Tax=Sphingobium arseniciresistens TaxID=3030834 RepID=UPI0023B945FB|nr:hypothetical protein [Sphingobium arseniciresistens]